MSIIFIRKWSLENVMILNNEAISKANTNTELGSNYLTNDIDIDIDIVER